MAKPVPRCVNIDWLEVYVLEDSQRYPCDADYFRRAGYFVKERDYGTRNYSQAFCIEDKEGNPWIEVRRAPQSSNSSFSGYVRESCNLRLVNRYCYSPTCIKDFTDFLLLHGYIFKHIFRIDLCYDFTRFDSGDDPETFAKRYICGRYRKINQAKIAVIGDDTWSQFDWQSLKWGNEKSMVSTKLYDKTLELKANKTDKTYIKYAWWNDGLIDHPIECYKLNDAGEKTYPHVWRIEFSMKSKARNWITIEFQGGKKVKKKQVPHRLDMFDTKEKMWQRFEELAFHYFRFKHKEYKNASAFILQKKQPPKKAVTCDGVPLVNSEITLELKRKSDCADKRLFNFKLDRVFHQLDQLPKDVKKNRDDAILRRRLIMYQQSHPDPKLYNACQVLLDNLTRNEWLKLAEHNTHTDYVILQRALALKLNHDERTVCEIIEALRDLLDGDSIF